MEKVTALLSGSGAFAVTFLVSLVVLAVFTAVYSLLTAHHEMTLIRAGNKAAALSLGGAIVGFVIPVGKAVAQSSDITDLLVWSAIAFVSQCLALGAASLLVPHFRKSIEDDHIASGIVLAALSVAIGILNASAMTVGTV